MKLLEKILVPISINDSNNNHLATADFLANKFHSELILTYILPEDARRESIKDLINRQVDASFAELSSQLSEGDKSITKKVVYGNAFDQIVTVSEDENANLIIISNDFDHEGDGPSLGLLGEKLIRKAEKPVWVVNESVNNLPKKILCTVDYSDASKRALNNAIKISRTFGAEITVLNVFEPAEMRYSPRYKIDFSEENKASEKKNKKRFKEFLKEFDFTDVVHNSQILTGVPQDVIVKSATENHIDLIFMGATGKTYIQRVLLGSVTESVIREVTTSLVITKSENILNLKIDSDITQLEKHFANSRKLEETGYYNEAIEQLKLCLHINDLHLPALSSIARLYAKVGDDEKATIYKEKSEEILQRLWNNKIELEIRNYLKF